MQTAKLFLLGMFHGGTALIFSPAARAAETTSFHFDFGGGPAVAGHIQIAPTNFYFDAVGYGFEPGADMTVTGGCVTSTKPFYFSVKLPEGNYRVTVKLGDKTGESTVTVKAGLRRLMLEQVHTAPGKIVTRSFSVNLRRPQVAGDGEVRLEPREMGSEKWDGDDKLPLAKFIVRDFKGFDPAHPDSLADFKMPASPNVSNEKPLGN
ncbi:MAG TPA: hypothetical protein VN836_04115 [Verrucomicrobiae bacterium]|nr:hypothetical protein [Verrucomicrobiae bacterium]